MDTRYRVAVQYWDWVEFQKKPLSQRTNLLQNLIYNLELLWAPVNKNWNLRFQKSEFLLDKMCIYWFLKNDCTWWAEIVLLNNLIISQQCPKTDAIV